MARKLDYDARGEAPPTSLACYAYLVEQRIRIIGDLWRLTDAYIAEHGPTSVRTVTIMREDWELPVGHLKSAEPPLWLGQVRTDLKSCRVYETGGGMIAGLHGNYEPATKTVRPHLHAVVFGDAAQAINRLRKMKAYHLATVFIERVFAAMFRRF